MYILSSEKKNVESERTKVLHTIDRDVKRWLEEESARSGRSESWLIEHAVKLWRKRLEAGRVKR